MDKKYNFDDIVKNFKFEGEFIEAKSHVCGHINDTFVLIFEKEDKSKVSYILQRINTNIFKNPQELMANIENVTEHIKNKIIKEGGNPLRETLNIIKTINNEKFYITDENDYFRAFIYITDAKTYQVVEEPIHMYKCGKALGKFQKQLSDFEVDKLYETIKDFHHTKKRYDMFLESVKADPLKRVEGIKDDIDFVIDRAKDCDILVNMIEEGKMPLRVTHNDTKFNNIMIDEKSDEAIAVIDLDTVMPGLIAYDFGDSIRSGATTALEDETELSKVKFDMNLYENFVKGFLQETKNSLDTLEIEYLPFGAKLMTFECGMRFLMDYIDGDIYFKIHKETHNLDRARNQFKLVTDMERNMDKMKEIVIKYSK
ncbi:MAG: phosphotransferase [Romboutsia sp.]